jgi:hypothetical protein
VNTKKWETLEPEHKALMLDVEKLKERNHDSP